MSKPEKNIENVYRQRLMNAEVKPPPKAWEKISNSLDMAAKNKRIILYRRIMASAAVIIILLSIGIGFLFQKRNMPPKESLTNLTSDSTIQNTDSTIVIPIKPIQENLADREQPLIETKNTERQSVNKETYAVKEPNIGPTVRTKSELVFMEQIAAIHLAFNFDWPSLLQARKNSKDHPFIYDAENNRLIANEDLIADATPTGSGKKRWSLGGEISPSHASVSASNKDLAYGIGSDVLNSYQPRSSSEESISAYTGGLAVNYFISDNLSVQSGLYYFRQGQEIQNFDVLTREASFENSITTTSNSGIIEFSSNEAIISNNPSQEIVLDAENRIAQFDEALIQQFGYIEVPFILRYKILSKKLNVYLLGGFNANILINNNVFIGKHSNNAVGHTTDINSLIYKSTLGLSFEYPISNNFYLNLSPIIKHQLNPTSKNNPGNTRISFFEYKTGISYRF